MCADCGERPVREVDMEAQPFEGEYLPFTRLELFTGQPLYCAGCFEALP